MYIKIVATSSFTSTVGGGRSNVLLTAWQHIPDCADLPDLLISNHDKSTPHFPAGTISILNLIFTIDYGTVCIQHFYFINSKRPGPGLFGRTLQHPLHRRIHSISPFTG